jgi:hypothetical protein
MNKIGGPSIFATAMRRERERERERENPLCNLFSSVEINYLFLYFKFAEV